MDSIMGSHNQITSLPTQPPTSPPPPQSPPSNPEKRPSTAPDDGPKKRSRISRACDFCHKRSIKCEPKKEGETRCGSCITYGQVCTSDRPVFKRGSKAGKAKSNTSPAQAPESDAMMLLGLTNSIQSNMITSENMKVSMVNDRIAFVEKNQMIIRELVIIFVKATHPMFPIFHRQTVLDKVNSSEYLNEQSSLAATMSICAVALARARDGAAPFPTSRNQLDTPTAEAFASMAKDILPDNPSSMNSFDWIRTCAMLVLYGIQVSDTDLTQKYLALYNAVVAMNKLHDEGNWPENIGIVEMEERRRLTWAMYSLEVNMSVVAGSLLRCREAQINVTYPNEVDDNFFSDAGYQNPDQIMTNPDCWVHGWNFLTDMYRILECSVVEYGRSRILEASRRFSTTELFNQQSPNPSAVLAKIKSMYNHLPTAFKVTEEDFLARQTEDSYSKSLQAAGIFTTVQILRMFVLAHEDETMERRTAVVENLLKELSKISASILRAMSIPLVHQLSHIGRALISAVPPPSDPSYNHVRKVLLPLADLLENLEKEFSHPVNASIALRISIGYTENHPTGHPHKTHPTGQLPTMSSSEAEAFHPTTTTSYPNPYTQAPSQSNITAVSNPNIDPSLQTNTSTSSSSIKANGRMAYDLSGFPNAFKFDPRKPGNASSSSGSTNAIAATSGPQAFDSTSGSGFQFQQLPGDILDQNLAWNGDSQSFGGGI